MNMLSNKLGTKKQIKESSNEKTGMQRKVKFEDDKSSILQPIPVLGTSLTTKNKGGDNKRFNRNIRSNFSTQIISPEALNEKFLLAKLKSIKPRF
jgi:hypothetical protein